MEKLVLSFINDLNGVLMEEVFHDPFLTNGEHPPEMQYSLA